MSPVPPSAARLRWAPVLLVAAVVAVWATSLGGAFVFDDLPAIVENPTLRTPGHLAAILAPPGDQAGTVGGRPLLNLSLALNFAAGGLDPTGYHVVNLAIHLAAALLLLGIVRRTLRRCAADWPETGRDAVAFLAALLWAVHPLQTEAVTYVVQRAESLMGLFYLLTLYGFIRLTDPDISGAANSRRRWSILTGYACLLGMATKEVMVTAPLAVLLYDAAFVTGSLREAWRRRRGLYLALAATWLLLAVLVASTHGRGGSAGFASSAGVWPYLLTQCAAITHYLRLALWPSPLVFDYGTRLIRQPGEVLWPMLAIAVLLVATGYAWRRSAPVGFLFAVFFLLLSPSSSFVPIATEPVAEHRMYLPLAAFVVLVVTAGYAGLRRLTPSRAGLLLSVLGLTAAVGLGAATIRRNHDYRSELALWADTATKAPGNPRAHNNLAEALRASGEPVRAAEEFAAAVQADPDYTPAQYNLGVTLLDSGRAQEAIPHLERARSAPRHQAELHQFLGEAYARTGQHAAAAENYRAALMLSPTNADVAFGLGNSLAAQGDFESAVLAFRAAVAAAPDQVRMRNNLANALLFSGHTAEAITQYREALRRAPDNAQIRENLERALQGNH